MRVVGCNVVASRPHASLDCALLPPSSPLPPLLQRARLDINTDMHKLACNDASDFELHHVMVQVEGGKSNSPLAAITLIRGTLVEVSSLSPLRCFAMRVPFIASKEMNSLVNCEMHLKLRRSREMANCHP